MMSRITSKIDLDKFALTEFLSRFFETLDWSDVYYKKIKPPIVPIVRFEGDTANFEDYPEADLKKVQTVSERQNELFADF